MPLVMCSDTVVSPIPNRAAISRPVKTFDACENHHFAGTWRQVVERGLQTPQFIAGDHDPVGRGRINGDVEFFEIGDGLNGDICPGAPG